MTRLVNSISEAKFNVRQAAQVQEAAVRHVLVPRRARRPQEVFESRVEHSVRVIARQLCDDELLKPSLTLTLTLTLTGTTSTTRTSRCPSSTCAYTSTSTTRRRGMRSSTSSPRSTTAARDRRLRPPADERVHGLLFNDETLNTPSFRLSTLSAYVVPEDGPLSMYREVCGCRRRPAEAFGQHPNADIAS